MKKHRKLKTVLLVVVGLFVLYNLVWLFLVWNRYHGFTEGMRELYSYQTYVIDEKDGYTYNVKIPDYLSFTGNLGIQPYEGGDCALIIWPGIFKETTYGAFEWHGSRGDAHSRRNARGRRTGANQAAGGGKPGILRHAV